MSSSVSKVRPAVSTESERAAAAAAAGDEKDDGEGDVTGFDQSDGKCGTGDATDAGESVAHADARASNGGRVDLAGEDVQDGERRHGGAPSDEERDVSERRVQGFERDGK